MRLGWSADSITAPEVARVAEAEGADFVSVHGRTATQLYGGAVDRGRIGEVVAAVRSPLLANGDLTRPQEGCVMLGDAGAAGSAFVAGGISQARDLNEVEVIQQADPRNANQNMNPDRDAGGRVRSAQ